MVLNLTSLHTLLDLEMAALQPSEPLLLGINYTTTRSRVALDPRSARTAEGLSLIERVHTTLPGPWTRPPACFVDTGLQQSSLYLSIVTLHKEAYRHFPTKETRSIELLWSSTSVRCFLISSPTQYRFILPSLISLTRLNLPTGQVEIRDVDVRHQSTHLDPKPWRQ
jgi:hypothetical protein